MRPAREICLATENLSMVDYYLSLIDMKGEQKMSSASRIVLVVGANGGIGSETALAFSRRGWKIRAFSRTKGSASGSSEWEWVKGDALDRASVVAASEGVHAIVHAV